MLVSNNLCLFLHLVKVLLKVDKIIFHLRKLKKIHTNDVGETKIWKILTTQPFSCYQLE